MIDDRNLGSGASSTMTTTSPHDTAADDTPVTRRWSPGGCVWCGSRTDIEIYRDEPRCGECREHENTIDAARRFIGMYGLRPLGGAVTSDDDEELEHRTAARSARAALDRVRLPKRPAAADVRKASARAGASAAVRTTPSRSSSSAPSGAVSTVDVAVLADRVTSLLEQLTAIETGIADAEASSGLPARARLSDLQRQRATVMSTLAALEKARRGSAG
ncbi:hypothetical protein [Rhodococcus sp. BP-241]|uniref:hypothetical protein n=1 Tax=Rhodococcus sp. BP-241 TaxID=2739441 RepID=UPI0027E14848|nr:hypothetical protein [Rhodococcus sp. BP-241]